MQQTKSISETFKGLSGMFEDVENYQTLLSTIIVDHEERLNKIMENQNKILSILENQVKISELQLTVSSNPTPVIEEKKEVPPPVTDEVGSEVKHEVEQVEVVLPTPEPSVPPKEKNLTVATGWKFNLEDPEDQQLHVKFEGKSGISTFEFLDPEHKLENFYVSSDGTRLLFEDDTDIFVFPMKNFRGFDVNETYIQEVEKQRKGGLLHPHFEVLKTSFEGKNDYFSNIGNYVFTSWTEKPVSLQMFQSRIYGTIGNTTLNHLNIQQPLVTSQPGSSRDNPIPIKEVSSLSTLLEPLDRSYLEGQEGTGQWEERYVVGEDGGMKVMSVFIRKSKHQVTKPLNISIPMQRTTVEPEAPKPTKPTNHQHSFYVL